MVLEGRRLFPRGVSPDGIESRPMFLERDLFTADFDDDTPVRRDAEPMFLIPFTGKAKAHTSEAIRLVGHHIHGRRLDQTP